MRRSLIAAGTAVAAVLMTMVAGPAPAAAAPAAKVMIVGDSISHGSSGDWTWRYRLWKHLQPRVTGLDFVGPRNDLFDNVAGTSGSQAYADGSFDRDHNALWGNTLSAAGDTIQGRTAAGTPDVMLVLLGINDLTFLTSPEGTEASLRRFIDRARDGKPDVKFVFGRVLPKRLPPSDTTFAGKLADYNNRLVRTAAELSKPESPIVVANTDAGFDPAADTWDGVHANPAGELKIAAAFADRLASAYAIGAAYPRPLPAVALGPRTAPTLSAAPGNGQAVLSWTASPGATGYYVWTRNVTAGEALHRLPWPVPASPWTAALLTNGATYEFQLQTTKGDNTGVFSNKVTVTPTVPPPAAPSGFTVTPGNGEATLSWTAPATATGAYIWTRNVTAGETLHRLPWPVQSPWTAALLTNGATYEFAVQSVSGLVEGSRTTVRAVTPTGPAPLAPTDLTATSGNGSATLRWTAKPNATGAYVWLRNITAGETLHKLPYPVQSPWTAAGLVNGAQYEFKVQSVNGLITGGVSAGAPVTPRGPLPRPPTDLIATASPAQIQLRWSASANATGYYVWVIDEQAGWWKRLPYPVSGTSLTYAPAINGHRYFFILQPVNGLQEADCVPLTIDHAEGCSNQAWARPEAPWRELTITGTKAQEQSTYCGPTAMQAVLRYFGVSVEQDFIADVTGTDAIGTRPWLMGNAMNRYAPSHPYDSTTNLDNGRVLTGVVGSIDQGLGPIVLLVSSDELPWGGGSFLQAHYLVVLGYKYDDLNGMGPQYRVLDPQTNTRHVIRASQWESMSYLEGLLTYVVAPSPVF
ncbi:GDSL-type esterase/lipase family protein [Actinoplanes sp. NPDC024001]|uniref:GDSL-type esterase/lipase family protein n=1 Tax=Actinoplanes sp. NPDC024001 TaxID=3154598 RepID=UPI0033D1BFD9